MCESDPRRFRHIKLMIDTLRFPEGVDKSAVFPLDPVDKELLVE
jgi:hypothetical protein